MDRRGGGLGDWDGLSWALALIAAMLAGVVYLQAAEGFMGPPSLEAAEAASYSKTEQPVSPRGYAAKKTYPKKSGYGRVGYDDADYSVVLERPAFSPNRRPTYDAPAAPKARAPDLAGLKLAATARDGSRRFALLQGGAASEYFKVAVGEALRGWRLLEIGGDGAVFERIAKTGEKSYGAYKKAGDRMIIDRDGARPEKSAARAD